MLSEFELHHQEAMIINKLEQLQRLYSEMEYHIHVDTMDPETYAQYDFRTRQDFKVLANEIYNICVAYLSSKGQNQLLFMFRSEVRPIIDSNINLYAGTYEEEGNDVVTTCFMVESFNKFLVPFPFFAGNSLEAYIQRAGLEYLERFLRNTANIINAYDKDLPTSEPAIYNKVKPLLKIMFPDGKSPSESFVKKSKTYKPDILLESLHCAVEYKFAPTRAKVISTMDEIIIDVAAYADNQIYKIFYAVFYVKLHECTSDEFTNFWNERPFPSNWKPILVFGNIGKRMS